MHPAVPFAWCWRGARRSAHTADHLKGRWVIRTNEGAPNFKLVSASGRAPDDRAGWRTLVPGRDQATLEAFTLLERGIAVQERVDADSRGASAGGWPLAAGGRRGRPAR